MPPPKLSKATLLKDLHRVARLRKDVKQGTYEIYGRYSLWVLHHNFGPWRYVLQAAMEYKPNAVIATATNSAMRSSQGQRERRRLTVETAHAGEEVPFKRWGKAEIERCWPQRAYGEIPARARTSASGVRRL